MGRNGQAGGERPRGATSKGHERRGSILDAAVEQLVEAGYAGFSIRQVAERAGLRLSNLQYYFPTRDALLEALLTRVLDDAMADFAGSGTDGQDLESVVRFVLGGQTPQACTLFLELWALAARDAGARASLDRFYAAYRLQIELAIAVVAPGIAAGERARRAAMVMALLEGVSLFRHPGGGAGSGLEAVVVDAVRRIVHADER